ncbi:WGR domain-containing protein, partial [Flavobacterium sp.]|uniref:WGR domain-containing protein n=1 Tax=Flavobacterium sp. TaxID=239 RepID=UPI00286CD7AC
QVSEKIFDDITIAEKEYNKLIAEKTKKGYLEVVENFKTQKLEENSTIIVFEDFNFKLQVIDHFIGKNIFDTELDVLKEKYWDMDKNFSYEPIPEIKKFFENLEIAPEILASITSFCPDGGDEVYGILIANWDGEDQIFDIQSLNDIKYLSNLIEFAPSAMIISNIDLSPLLQCEKLASITIYRDDISYAVPFMKKGIAVNHWKSSIVPMRFQKFATIKHLFPDDCWISERNKNNKAEFDGETILHILGDWEIDNLDLDNIFNQEENPEHIFTILVEGNLKAKNIFNENTDGGTGIIVLGDATADNMIVGGQEIYITRNLTINECFWGEYNHGDLTVKGQTDAKVFVATNEYHYDYDQKSINAEHFLLDEDENEDEIEYNENIIKSIFVPEVIITEEEFDDEVFSWENFLDRGEIIEFLKSSKPILNNEIDLNPIRNPTSEGLKNIPILFNIKTFENEVEFEKQWQNFDKIIDFSLKQTETDSFEFDIYQGNITKKSSSNKMTFIGVDFPDKSSFFIQKKETEPTGFLEKLKLKSNTFYLHAMYRTHSDASYEYVFDDDIETDIEVLEKLKTFWFLFLERAERAIHFYDLFYQTIKIRDLENYLKFPVIQQKYNDYNDSDKHGFWAGNYFFRFNRQGNPKEAGVIGIGKEIKSSDEFDIRSYFIKLNKHENPTNFGLHYCSSQSGNAVDRYNDYSKIVYFMDWEKYFEFLKWYPKLDKALQTENEDFLNYPIYEDHENIQELSAEIKNKIFPKTIENVTFCGIDFRVISRLEADELIGDLKDLEGKRIYDVHQMSSVDCDLESRKKGFFLLCETELQTDILEIDSEIEGQDNITILGFIFKENVIINKSLQSKYEDFSTPFIALKNVMIQNAYFCGDSHYIGGDFICQIIYSHYNFGELIVNGNAKIFVIKSTNMKMYFANLTSVNAIINDSKKDIYVQIDIENDDGSISKEIAIQPPTHYLEDVFLVDYIYFDEKFGHLIENETFLDAFKNGKPLIDESKFLNKYADFILTFPDRIQKIFEIEILKNLAIDETFFEDIIVDSQYNFFVKKEKHLQMGFWNTIYNYSMYINYFETGETQFITQHYESDNETPKFGFTTTVKDNLLNTFAIRKMFCDAEKLILNKYNQ